MSNDLKRVVYRSLAHLLPDDVAGRDVIFRKSVSNNRRDHITGCLAQPDGHFVQVIEGAKSKVDALMDRIKADARHENVTILGEWTVQNRLFRGWAMARPDPTPMNDQSFRVCTENGSGVQVTSVLLGLMAPGDHLYSMS